MKAFKMKLAGALWKFAITLLLIQTTSCSIKEDQEPLSNLTVKEQIALEHITKKYNLKIKDLEISTVNVKGIDVPMLTSKLDSTIYSVLIDKNDNIKAILEQKTKISKDSTYHFFHYANSNFIGEYSINNNQLIDFQGKPINKNRRISNECIQEEGESCAGCHYRQLLGIIEKDGDAALLCNLTEIACHAAIYTAAVIHCWKVH
jgi:hypothetical protein